MRQSPGRQKIRRCPAPPEPRPLPPVAPSARPEAHPCRAPARFVQTSGNFLPPAGRGPAVLTATGRAADEKASYRSCTRGEGGSSLGTCLIWCLISPRRDSGGFWQSYGCESSAGRSGSSKFAGRAGRYQGCPGRRAWAGGQRWHACPNCLLPGRSAEMAITRHPPQG